MDHVSFMGWLMGAGVAGLVTGALCARMSGVIVSAMVRRQERSPRLRALRRRVELGGAVLQKFRVRSGALSGRIKGQEFELRGLRDVARQLTSQVKRLRERPRGLRWMVSDERSGLRCLAATVSRAKRSSDDPRDDLPGWAESEWTYPSTVVIWSDGRSDAVHRLETSFPKSHGFEIYDIRSYDGEEGAP